jgi:hypothetical protein
MAERWRTTFQQLQPAILLALHDHTIRSAAITHLLLLDQVQSHSPETALLKRRLPALAAHQRTGRQDPQPPAEVAQLL